jgi:MFS family permease
VLDDELVRRFVWTYMIAGGCALIPEALAPALVQGELGRGPALVGLLAAVVPVAVIFTTVAIPRHGDDEALLRSAGMLSAVGCGLAAVVFALKPDMPYVVLPFLAVGITFTSRVPGTQMVALRLDDRVRANAYAVISACMAGGMAVIPLVAGLFVQYIGVRHTAAVFLFGAAMVSVYAVLFPPARAPLPVIEPGATRQP